MNDDARLAADPTFGYEPKECASANYPPPYNDPKETEKRELFGRFALAL